MTDAIKADILWAQLIGSVYTGDQVAALLKVSEQEVGIRKDLLRLIQRDGQIVYPVLQFKGNQQVEGLGQVLEILSPVVATSWTIASWLASPQGDELLKPIDELKSGNKDKILLAAKRFAHHLKQ